MVTAPCAIVLSVCAGVGGCGWPISSTHESWMQSAPNSVSAADDITLDNLGNGEYGFVV